MFEWLIASSLQFVIFGSVKNNRIMEMLEIVQKSVHWIIWCLLIGFKTITLCSLRSIRFTKYVFSVDIWFEKTSPRIVKYKSQVHKSNLEIQNMKIKSVRRYNKILINQTNFIIILSSSLLLLRSTNNLFAK